MVGVIFVYVDTVYGIYGYSLLWLVGCFSMIIWTPAVLSVLFQHDYLDTCCFECLICMCFVFLYLHLFSATEHVSHGKAL